MNQLLLQAFIYYGPIPNNRILRVYGFIQPDNPHDSYDLVLTTHPMAACWQQKQQLWTAAGLDSTCTISLTLSDPLPRERDEPAACPFPAYWWPEDALPWPVPP